MLVSLDGRHVGSLRMPSLCVACGARNPTDKLTISTPWHHERSKRTLSLPLCSDCRVPFAALEQHDQGRLGSAMQVAAGLGGLTTLIFGYFALRKSNCDTCTLWFLFVGVAAALTWVAERLLRVRVLFGLPSSAQRRYYDAKRAARLSENAPDALILALLRDDFSHELVALNRSTKAITYPRFDSRKDP